VIKCPICRNKIEPIERQRIERQTTVFTTVNQIQRIEIQSIEFTTVNPIYIYIQPVREPDYNNSRSRTICGLFICMGFLGITLLSLLYPRD
jgi:ABC-type polysaccharide/polyol phosphate export permease